MIKLQNDEVCSVVGGLCECWCRLKTFSSQFNPPREILFSRALIHLLTNVEACVVACDNINLGLFNNDGFVFEKCVEKVAVPPPPYGSW